MSIKITNIYTEKEHNIFWKDKNIKLMFNVISEDSEYKIDSIYIEWWMKIVLNSEVKDTINQKYKVIDNDFISSRSIKTYSIDIPIKYPNINRKESALEIKNYLKIVLITKNSKFKIFQEFYPDIRLVNKEINWQDLNLYNMTTEKYNQLLESLNKTIWNIEESLQTTKESNNTSDVSDLNTKDLSDIVTQELSKLCSPTPNKDNILINKSFFWLHKDYVNKGFYKYICKNFPLFNLREKLRNNIFIKWLYIFSFITLLFLLILNDSLQIIEFKTFYIWIIFVTLIIITLPYFILQQKWINLVTNKIIKIIPHKKNILKDKIINENIDINTIFKTLEIDYTDKFECVFEVYLTCKLVGNRDNNIYNTDIYMIQIWEYKWNKFHQKQIADYTHDGILDNMYIQPWEINKRSLLKVMPTYARIEYSIIYSFKSLDLTNKYEIITI